MKTWKYKIERRSITQITDDGEIEEDVKFYIYRRIFGCWLRINKKILLYSGDISRHSLSFKTPEIAERYIKVYHSERKKLGKIIIKTEKIIEI